MKKILFLTFLFIIFLTPIAAHASVLPPCTQTGNCGMCDALWVISAITRWILGVVGIAALLMFIYGGFLWITAAGVSIRVQQGQKVMSSTVVGIIIVALTWTAINFVIASLTGQDYIGQNKVKIIQGMSEEQAWYEICTGTECEGKGDGHPCNGRNKHCLKGSCTGESSACEYLAQFKNYQNWECRPFGDCGLSSYKECDIATNCIRFLCPGGNENVCCKP